MDLGLWAQVQCLIQEARFCKPHGMVKKKTRASWMIPRTQQGKGTNCAHSPTDFLDKNPVLPLQGPWPALVPGPYPVCHMVKPNNSAPCSRASALQGTSKALRSPALIARVWGLRPASCPRSASEGRASRAARGQRSSLPTARPPLPPLLQVCSR